MNQQEPVYLHDAAVYKFVKEVLGQFLPLPDEGKGCTASELSPCLQGRRLPKEVEEREPNVEE